MPVDNHIYRTPDGRHIRNHCPTLDQRSREISKRGIQNLKKFNPPGGRNNQRRRREEVQPLTNSDTGREQSNLPPEHIDNSVVMDSDVMNVDTMVHTGEPLPNKRIRRPTWKVRETAPIDPAPIDLPEGPGILDSPDSSAASDAESILLAEDSSLSRHELSKICTIANRFGVIREYQQRPTVIPDINASWRTLVVDHTPAPLKKHREVMDIIFPYPNLSSFLYNLTWRRMSGVLTSSNRTLMANMLTDERFKNEDIKVVNFSKIEKLLADDVQSPWGGNGWKRSTVVIEVPTGLKPTAASRRKEQNERARRQRHDEVDPDADPYPRHRVPIHGVRTRSLLHTMLETIQEDSVSKELHWHGYKEVWQPAYPGLPPERVWGELFTSDSFLKAERDLNNAEVDSETQYHRVIAAYMIWSDSTHLAQFGQAKAWPIYAYFGNQSKYTRCKPTSRSSQIIGYVPPACDILPDSFSEQLEACGVAPTPVLFTHCRRELFHAVWRLIFDDDFLNAYEYGVVVTCLDGVTRLVYPRIFTYSADYPEKHMGGFPLIWTGDIWQNFAERQHGSSQIGRSFHVGVFPLIRIGDIWSNIAERQHGASWIRQSMHMGGFLLIRTGDIWSYFAERQHGASWIGQSLHMGGFLLIRTGDIWSYFAERQHGSSQIGQSLHMGGFLLIRTGDIWSYFAERQHGSSQIRQSLHMGGFFLIRTGDIWSYFAERQHGSSQIRQSLHMGGFTSI
ncbi:hypothetical protein EDB85DRAFT_2159661 [Lactarius pseudohatsudake]|nr:hypothetical protein EDB85DRAFT_2159661 [Lactarius pseudohatsudake]